MVAGELVQLREEGQTRGRAGWQHLGSVRASSANLMYVLKGKKLIHQDQQVSYLSVLVGQLMWLGWHQRVAPMQEPQRTGHSELASMRQFAGLQFSLTF